MPTSSNPISVGIATPASADVTQSLLLDTELIVPSDMSRDRQFSIASPSFVNVQVQGLRDADKGFDVLVFSDAEYLRYLRDEVAIFVLRDTMVRSSNQT